MSSFSDDLQSALGTQYRLDRELGGGGMSRVFVAEETALRRLVVVKLLPPEMAAAVSEERFRREIQLVARLQHPHIVPVLSAGSANGLLYYTMPFVDGRSLRERIARDGALPADEATSIISEVAGALGYAHAQGLVHRDIKPENVLLSQGHALVTDFGIAKALSQGPADAPAGTVGGLTGMGMSIGTPAYMSPEQGVGDPATDHRADIYSLGIMAYELLAGVTPFADRTTTHALLMAHMVETPPPLDERQPDLPTTLTALVMRCLSKKPEDRPATGDEIVRALRGSSANGESHRSGVGTAPRPAAPAATTPSGKRARTVWAGVAVLLLVAAAAGVLAWRRFAPALGAATATTVEGGISDRLTVTTFANETGDPSLDGMGRMTADWLTTALAGTGLVKVLDARAALGAAGAGSDAANAIKTARDLGAGTVVTGSYYKLGDTLQFDVKLLDTRTTEVLQVLESVKGPAAEPTRVIDLVRQRTLGALATRLNPLLSELAQKQSRPPSYDAYQQIVAGIDAFFAGKMTEARERFVRASQLDTANVQSRTWLLEVLESTGQLDDADSVARHLEARRERLSPLEQAQLDEYTSSIRANPTANLAATFRMHALAPNGQWRATLTRKLMLANRWQEALDTLNAAPAEIGLFKDKPYPLEQQRMLLHRLGRHAEEITVAKELVRRFKLPRFQFDLARSYAALGNADSARVLAERIAASTPEAGSARNLLRAIADELRWHGHDADANTLLEGILASYDHVSADSVSAPSILRGRAETLARLGRWSEAMNAVRPFASQDTSLGTRMSMAVGSAHNGDNALADKLDAELAAMPVDPYRPGGMLYLRARLAMARGDRAGTMALLKAAQAKAFPLFDGVHGVFEFQALRGDPALDALLKPTS